jgi:hypothetical protein
MIEIKNVKELKTCSKCKQNFLATSEFFYKHRNRKDGLDPWCKKCKREYDKNHHKLKNFNISFSQYKKMLEEQDNRCLICGIKFDVLSKLLCNINTAGEPNIDHDHKTGKIRGILCNMCNRLLGFAFDNPLILIKAAKYLQEDRIN